MKWHIINVVWGEEYLKTFIDLSIPSQLSKGNIPDIPKDVQAIYRIYIDRTAKDKFLQSHAFQSLKSHIEVELCDIQTLAYITGYKILAACHSDSIKKAVQESAILIFLAPDCIYSQGVFASYYKYLKMGKKLIATPCIRLSKEKIIESLTQSSFLPSPILSFSSQELTKIALKNLHPMTLSHFRTNKKIHTHCSHIYWWLDKETILIRPFHIHPFVIDLQNKIFPKDSIDGDFICRAVPDKSLWKLILNSEESIVFELSNDNKFSPFNLMTPSKSNIYLWTRKYARPAHHYFISHKFYLGTGKRKPEWRDIEQKSDQLIKWISSSKQIFKIILIPKIWFNFFLKYCFRYLKAMFLIITGKKKVTIKQVFQHFFSPGSKKIETVVLSLNQTKNKDQIQKPFNESVSRSKKKSFQR